MLLINGKQFIPTSKDPEHAIQRAHYEESIKYIKETYGQNGRNNTLKLIRRKEPVRNATGLLEETSPMIFPAKAYPTIQFAQSDAKKAESMGGIETWAYSKNRPLRKNDQFEPDPKSIKIMSHTELLDMVTQMDLIYFLLYKSPKVYYPPAIEQGKVRRGDLIVEDKAAMARERIRKERDELKLRNAIMAPDQSYPLHSDAALRKVAAAWGLDGATDPYESVDELRLRLRENVVGAEKLKSKRNRGKGVAEFLEMINFDDAVRQRALIMYALDHKKVVYDWSKMRYLYASTDTVLADIPAKDKDEPFDYLSQYLLNEVRAKEWDLFRKEIIDEQYIESLAYDDLKWLAKQNDLTVSQKNTEQLKKELTDLYCA